MKLTWKGELTGGPLIRRLRQRSLSSRLKKAVRLGEPEYAHYAKSRKKNDIGDTYVEVDLGSQHMWFYKDGETMYRLRW